MSKEHIFSLQVYYEDTDVGGVVYYANYLKFTERARTEMIYKLLDINHTDLKKKHDVIFVVKTCDNKYLKSAKFEDKLTIVTSIIKKSPVRLNLIQEVKRNKELLVTSKVELAVVNTSGLIKKLPKTLYSKI
jgi:acyl-CoA thioester hydrolase